MAEVQLYYSLIYRFSIDVNKMVVIFENTFLGEPLFARRGGLGLFGADSSSKEI